MEITATFWDDRVQLMNGHMEYDNHYLHISLSEYIEEYFYQENRGLSKYTRRDLTKAIAHRTSPEYCKWNAFGFLKKTVEGQEFLEYVFSRLGIRFWLDLEPAEETIEQMRHTIGDKEKWEESFEPPEIDVEQRFIDLVGTSSDKYIYVISVVDSEDIEFYYVGETQNPCQRLRQHVSSGGSFAEAKRRDGTYVTKIHSIESGEKVSEWEKYQQIKESVPEKVFGGR